MLKKYLVLVILVYSTSLLAKGMERQFTMVNDPETDRPKQVYITGTKIKKDNKGNVIYTMSLKNGWMDGPTTRYDPDGNIEEVKHFKKGLRVGFLNRYFSNGQLKQHTYFENGKKEGDEFIYDSSKRDGKTLRTISHYIQGLKDGEQKSFRSGVLYKVVNYYADAKINFSKVHGPTIYYGKKGQITSREYYLDGRLHGLKQSYTKDGKLKRETCFQHGKQQKGLISCKGGTDKLETITELHENGKVKFEYQVKNGMLNGYRRTFADSGLLIVKEHFLKDKKEGLEARYYDDGKKLGEFHWARGMKDGSFEWYYMNGNTKREMHFKGGKLHGKAVYFYDDGKVDVESNYKMGSREGKLKSYYAGGEIALEATYENDKLEGPAKFYVNNKLTQEFIYHQGLLTSSKEWGEDGKLKSKNQYYKDGSRILRSNK